MGRKVRKDKLPQIQNKTTNNFIPAMSKKLFYRHVHQNLIITYFIRT